MKSLLKIASSFVGENMDLFPIEFIAELPGPVLESILPYMSAYWLHTIHQSLVNTGVKCEWLWHIHIRRRWGLGVQSTMNVFQEELDKDPRKIYLMKHFHDLLNFCTLSVNTRDPHNMFVCPIHRLDRREAYDPARAMGVPLVSSSSSAMSSFLHDGRTNVHTFHLDQLLKFSVYAQTLRVVGSQCGWIAGCTPLLENLLKITERLQLITLTDTYYSGMRTLVVTLMTHGVLTKAVLSTIKLSEPYLLDFIYVCSGRFDNPLTDLPNVKTGICKNCSKMSPDVKKSSSNKNETLNDKCVNYLSGMEPLCTAGNNLPSNEEEPGPSTSVGTACSSGPFGEHGGTSCLHTTESVLWEKGYDSDSSTSSEFEITNSSDFFHESQDIDLYDEAITPLPPAVDTLENLVLAHTATLRPSVINHPNIHPSLFRCTQCHSTNFGSQDLKVLSQPASGSTSEKSVTMESVSVATKVTCDKLNTPKSPSQHNDVKDSGDHDFVMSSGSFHGNLQSHEQNSASVANTKGLESFALLSTANRYDISSVLTKVLPGWTSLTKFGVFDVDMKTEELTEQLMEKVHSHQLSHLVLDDVSVHPTFFQKFLHTLYTDYRLGEENSQALELLDFQACAKPIEVNLPLSPGVFIQGVRKLDLSMNSLSESGFLALLNLIKYDVALVHLKLNGCFLQEEQVLQLLEVLAENARIEAVSLSGNRVVEEAVETAMLKFMEKCVSLKTLVLNYSRLRSSFVSSDDFIRVVREHPSLQELSIKNNHLESGALNFLIAISCCPQRPSLRSLNIGYNWIKGQDLIEAAQKIRAHQRLNSNVNTPVLDFLSLSGNRLLHSFQQQLRQEYKGLVKDLEANSIDFSRPYAEHVGQM